MDLRLLGSRAAKFLVDNSPSIMTGLAVAGTITTAILTGRATFKAAREIDQVQNLRFHDDLDDWELTPKQKVELTWTHYIPPVATGVLTVALIIGANQVGSRRTAALAAAYSILDRGFEEYRAKVTETIGEKKELAVRDAVVQDRINRDPVENREIVLVGQGDVLCRDSYSGRYFSSNVESIRRAANDINARIIHDSYACLTDFYDLIGLSSTAISDEVGWTLDKMLEIRFSSALTEENRPCLSVEFRVDPVRNYQWLL